MDTKIAHARLLHSMRRRAHRPMVEGAPVVMTKADLIERQKPTSYGIDVLSADIESQFVFADPAGLRVAALTVPGGDQELQNQIDTLTKIGKILEERCAHKTPLQICKEIEFSAKFFSFRKKWSVYHQQLLDLGEFGEADSKECLSIDSADHAYRTLIEEFCSLGGQSSYHPPAAYGPTDVLSVQKPIPWGKVAIVGGGLAFAAWWMLKRRTPTKLAAFVPETRSVLGPPQLIEPDDVYRHREQESKELLATEDRARQDELYSITIARRG